MKKEELYSLLLSDIIITRDFDNYEIWNNIFHKPFDIQRLPLLTREEFENRFMVYGVRAYIIAKVNCSGKLYKKIFDTLWNFYIQNFNKNSEIDAESINPTYIIMKIEDALKQNGIN